MHLLCNFFIRNFTFLLTGLSFISRGTGIDHQLFSDFDNVSFFYRALNHHKNKVLSLIIDTSIVNNSLNGFFL
ncbi:MAG: hypothetical protein EXX96DRAFT_555920, partial [Benjaminiella poitrasii]